MLLALADRTASTNDELPVLASFLIQLFIEFPQHLVSFLIEPSTMMPIQAHLCADNDQFSSLICKSQLRWSSLTMFSRLIKRIFIKPPSQPPCKHSRRPWKGIDASCTSSQLPRPVDLPWTIPRAEYKSTLFAVRKRVERELNSPDSAIWRNIEKVGVSEYPESFHTRGGLEIECMEDEERAHFEGVQKGQGFEVWGWSVRELQRHSREVSNATFLEVDA